MNPLVKLSCCLRAHIRIIPLLCITLSYACGSRGNHSPESIRDDDTVGVRPGTGSEESPSQPEPEAPIVLREVPAFKVVGYAPSWQGNPAAIPYADLDFINYSFALPTNNGTVRPIDRLDKLKTITTRAHEVGTRVLLAVGGWNNGDDSPFVELTKNPETLTTFVDNLLALIETHRLDGIDLDWEYPDEEEAQGFTDLARRLSEKLKPEGKYLTAAVAANRWGTDGITAESLQYFDFINIMAYDGGGGGGANHSPMSLAETSLEFWAGKGLTSEKAILGVPFYSRPGHIAYSQLIALDASAADRDEHNGEYYNGIPTIQAKTTLARQKGSGIMIWELSQDVHGDLSLMGAIKTAIATP